MRARTAWIAILALCLTTPCGSIASDTATPEKEIMQRWLGRLDGRHFAAVVMLTLERTGMTEERKVAVWRDDEHGRERLMARFEEPYDMRGVGLLYIQNLDRPNDYFLYQPSIKRVRRISQSLAREDIYGIDLEYLGFGLAQREPVDVEAINFDLLDGHKVLRVKQRARSTNPRFDLEIVWIDPSTYVPLQTIHYHNGEMVLRARTEEVQLIQGVPTPTRSSFEREARQETVRMTVEHIDYEATIPEVYFSTFSLVENR
jgi:hypothetical protein